MNVSVLFVAADACAITLLVLIGARYLTVAPRERGAWLIALLLLGIVCYHLSSRQDYGTLIEAPFRADFGNLFPLLNVLRNATSGVFMLLCHAIFKDGQRTPRLLLGLLVLQLLLEEPLDWVVDGQWAETVWGTVLLEGVPSLLQTLFLGMALYWMLSERDADLVLPRRRARVLLLIIYVVQVVLSLTVERVAMNFGWIPWEWQYPVHMMFVAVGIPFSVIVLFASMSPAAASLFGGRRAEEPRPAGPSRQAPAGSDTERAEVARIRAAFEEDLIYHQAGLSVAGLARHLALPEYRLRNLIHQHMGYRNFNALLHHYRIAEVCRALEQPARNHLPVLTLALTAGYQSINPFNRAFRELKGMTPTEYRRQARQRQVESSNCTAESATGDIV